MRAPISPAGMQRNVQIGRLSSVCLAALVIIVWGSSARAQQYDSVPVETAARSARTVVQNVWDNPSQFQDPATRQEFDRYFKEYLFPAMTQSSATGLRDLGGHRKQLLRWLQRPAPNSEQVYAYVLDMTLKAMQTIAAGNYHPIARYNAMLVIGTLDQRPGDPPVPLPQAADFMVKQLQSGAPDAVQVAALIGLERHAQYGMADETRKAVAEELIKITAAPRPGDRTADVHAWFQFRAASVLTQMKSLGENNQIHDALVAVMNNDNIPVADRAYVAGALQNLKDQYTPQAGIDAAVTAAALGNVLADVMEDEETEARKFNEQQRTGGGMAYGPYAMLGEEPPGYPRGRFLQRVGQVLGGFDAVQGALPDDLKQEMQTVRKPVEELRTLALDRNETDVGLTIRIEKLSDEIAFAAGDLGQAAAPPPSDDEGGLDALEELN